MFLQTPLVETLPPYYIPIRDYQRTPVVDGVLAQSLTDLILSHEDVDPQVELASITLAELAPDEEKIWAQTHGNLLFNSLAYFFAEMIRGPEEAPYLGKSLVGRHHEAWDVLVNEHDRLVIMASRDHGKSHFFSLAYPIWMAGYRMPKSLGYMFSSTQETASALLGILKNELLGNERFEHLLPEDRDNRWSKREIFLANGSVIRARGFGVKVRGGHPQWIVADDCLTDNDIYSETVRRKNIDYYLSAITNMIVPGGQINVVGTPMHETDLYGYLKSTRTYYFQTFPAIDTDQRILFPERYDRKRLEERKQEVGAARFGREFLVTPLSDEASLFPAKLFEGSDVRLPYTLGLTAEYWNEKGMLRYTGVDLAMSAEIGADYTVIFTIAIDVHGNRWLVNIRRGKGFPYQSQLDEITEQYTLFQPELIFVESNQFQRIISSELIRTTDLPIVSFNTAANTPKKSSNKHMGKITLGKHSLDRGVAAMRIMFENRKWRIPRGDVASIEMTDQWIGEMGAMSIADGKIMSVGSHDDTVMACWMADAAARHGSLFRFVDDTTVEEQEALKIIEQAEKIDDELRIVDDEHGGEYTMDDTTFRYF